MIWNRKQPQDQQRVASPSFRPQLECLEARTMLDASGTPAMITNDLDQAVTDAAHLQGPAVQQDASKIGRAVSSDTTIVQGRTGIIAQARATNAADFFEDLTYLYTGLQIMATGTAIASFGAGLSEVGVGIPIAVGGVAIGTYGANMAYTALEKGIGDGLAALGEVLPAPSGGQEQPIPTPTSVGTWSATRVPDTTNGNVHPNTPQKITLNIYANGSGNLSVSPFAGSGLAVSFPAETIEFIGGGEVVADYTSAGYKIGFDLSPNGAAQLQGEFNALNSKTFDYVYYTSVSLNRQG